MWIVEEINVDVESGGVHKEQEFFDGCYNGDCVKLHPKHHRWGIPTVLPKKLTAIPIYFIILFFNMCVRLTIMPFPCEGKLLFFGDWL